MRRRTPWRRIGLQEFRTRFDCDVRNLPQGTSILGRQRHQWFVYGEWLDTARLASVLRFLDRSIVDRLGVDPFWFLCTVLDGWRERNRFSSSYRWVEPRPSGPEWRGAPGEVPRLSERQPWVVCFAAHHGDPSALLMPEVHFLATGGYRRLFLKTLASDRPWRAKRAHAVYCGADLGEAVNLVEPARAANARRLLAEVVAQQGLEVDVHLGAGVSLRSQLAYKYVLDVDGWVHTFDAWAWKTRSRSVVLSQASFWETFFSREFHPWEHFVPVANDFNDLGEKLAWCRSHDDECRAISRRASRRGREVYQLEGASRSFAQALAARLAEGASETSGRDTASPASR